LPLKSKKNHAEKLMDSKMAFYGMLEVH